MNQDCLFDNLADSTPNPVLVGVAVCITSGKIMLLFQTVCTWPLRMDTGHSTPWAHRPVRTSLFPGR